MDLAPAIGFPSRAISFGLNYCIIDLFGNRNWYVTLMKTAYEKP